MTAPHRGLDTTADLTPYLAMLQANGVTHASQYLRAGGLNKIRADAIRAARINLILNFEGRGDDINAFSAQTGTRDATYARQAALALGAPAGIAIYFSCEPQSYGNLTSAYTSRVLPYWNAVQAVLRGQYRVGAYTFGTWLDWLARDGANEFNWLPNASGWPGYRDFLASGRVHYHQIPGGSNVNFNGLILDWDEPNPTMADIGAWAPSAAVGGAAGAVVPSTPTPSSAHPTLRKGDRGPEVIAMQTLLQSAIGGWWLDGRDPVTQDGVFGPKTEAAVKAFQASADLTADGIVGPLTWAKLLAPA